MVVGLPEPTGQPNGVLRHSANEIVLKIPGAAGLHGAKSG